MANQTINALDLFSGAGGFSLGMEQAGIHVVAAVEYDAKIANTYALNHPHTVMINDDIRNVAALDADVTSETHDTSIEQIFREQGKEVDVIFGGPPCQGFSMAGYRIRGQKPFFEDERNLLYLEYMRMVEKLMPKVFVIENVPGIINFADGAIYREITERFAQLGYDVHAQILSAEQFGVPQKRKRAFFIGNRLGVPSAQLFPQSELTPTQYTTVWQALSDLPSLKSGEGREPMHYEVEAQTDYQRLMRAQTGDAGFYNHVSAIHKPVTLDILKMIKPGQTMKDLPEHMRTKSVHSGAYGRMNPDEPAYTITTRINTPSVGRITHPVDDRTITPREAARIQSFPDHYRFLGDITTIGMQIGNSVPPLLAQRIGDNIVTLLQR